MQLHLTRKFPSGGDGSNVTLLNYTKVSSNIQEMCVLIQAKYYTEDSELENTDRASNSWILQSWVFPLSYFAICKLILKNSAYQLKYILCQKCFRIIISGFPKVVQSPNQAPKDNILVFQGQKRMILCMANLYNVQLKTLNQKRTTKVKPSIYTVFWQAIC